jgi:PAS domain-containing protein
MGAMAEAQKPLELILARNLLSSISTPAFLVDAEGTLVFFNEAAGTLVGRRFEETGALGPREWGEAFGPFDASGQPIPWDRLPLTIALQHGRPMHSRMHIHSNNGELRDIEVSALPIVGTEGFRGAIAIFWPVTGDEDGAAA